MTGFRHTAYAIWPGMYPSRLIPKTALTFAIVWCFGNDLKMTKAAVNPSSLMKPVGFSHGFEVRGGRILFLAGQVAFDKKGAVVGKGNLLAQFRQVCENLRAVVEAQGGTLQDVVKLTIYVLDKKSYMDNRPALGRIYREYFGRHYPAMTLVEVKGLYDQTGDIMLEIDGVAALN